MKEKKPNPLSLCEKKQTKAVKLYRNLYESLGSAFGQLFIAQMS